MRNWMPRLGLSFKMIFLICVNVTAIIAVIFTYIYKVSHDTILNDLKESSRLLTLSTVHEVEKNLVAVQKVANNLAVIIQNRETSNGQLEELLIMAVENNPEILGAAISFEPAGNGPAKRFGTLYVGRRGKALYKTYSDAGDYEDHIRDWYLIPKELKKALWSEPYYDEVVPNVKKVTYSVPIHRNIDGHMEFVGILAADLSLDLLDRIVSSIKVYQTGYAYMISRNGSIVSHPKKEYILNTTIFSLAEETNSPVLDEIGRNMVRGRSSFAEVEYHNLVTGKKSWLTYAPVSLSGWSLGIVYPVEELTSSLNDLFKIVIIFALIGATILLIVIVFISRSITRPLRKLAFASRQISGGNFHAALPVVKTRDEIGDLTKSFGLMQEELSQTIGRLKAANDELENYSRTLEEKVESRTAEIKEKNSQLIQAEKMASLGQLTAGIAHEIKNPLNFINNFAELSVDLAEELAGIIEKESGKLDKSTVEYLRELLADVDHNVRKIGEHGRRADSIVKGMLLHSRGKSGEKQKTNLHDLIDEGLNLAYHGFRAQDANFNVKMEKHYDRTIEPIDVVPQNISRVLLNMFNNSFYSMNEKKTEKKYNPQLVVITENRKDRVVIRIWDNGRGIPADIIDKVFNPFFTTKPTGKGTGLGLSLSYDIVVQEHRGEIKVKSEVGEYAEFTIVLPKIL